MTIASVTVRESKNSIPVKIRDDLDAAAMETLGGKWQHLLDLISELIHVPAALIMRLHATEIEVFSKSSNISNPYHVGEKATLGDGLYCETVIGTRDELVVPDALASEIWSDNPDVALNMISYVGYPISWPNGDVFGTICALDCKRNDYNDPFKGMLQAFRNLIEKDLELIESRNAIASNMDALLKLQGQLIHYERIKAMDQLVAGIAHEINTPIGIALTTASFMDSTLKELESVESKASDAFIEIRQVIREGTGLISKNLKKASELIKSFKLLTWDLTKGDKEIINVVEHIECVLMSMKYELKLKSVSYELSYEEHLTIATYPGLLAQVLMNLVSNSLKHGFKDSSEGVIRICVTKTDTGIRIRYSDDGSGIEPGMEKLIFEPFFTLTPEKAGSGMGLCIVKEIVEKSLCGAVTCERKAEKGATFVIELPKECL